MNRKIRIIIELVFLMCLLLVSFFTTDIQTTFLGMNYLEFVLNLLGFYVFIRILISLIVTIIKYKTKGRYRNYEGEVAKIYFENSIYGHLAIIFFLLIFSSTLAMASLGLFLIFGILWLLSKLSMMVTNKSGVGKLNKDVVEDEKYIEMYGEDLEDFYNFIYIEFYSDLGFEFFKILSDNTFGVLNNYYNENSIILLDKLSKSNYLFLVPRSLFFGDVNLLCGVFNSYLEKLEIKCEINPSDILDLDDLKISNRRRDYLDTLPNDLMIIDGILKKKKYRVISIGVDDGEETYLCLSVVSDSVYRRIKNFSKKNSKE